MTRRHRDHGHGPDCESRSSRIRFRPSSRNRTSRVDRVVASADMRIYISQSARENPVGAEIDPYTSYSTRSTFSFAASAAARAIDLFPFMAKLRLLANGRACATDARLRHHCWGRRRSMDSSVDRLGTWGFKAIPIGGKSMA